MKTHAILPFDATTFASEMMTYLNSTTNVEDSEHHVHAFHLLDNAVLANTSFSATFTNLTAKAIAHLTINGTEMFNHCYGGSFMLVPLADCETTVVKTFDVAPGATLQTPEQYYLDSDCTLADTVSLTSPVLIGANTTYTIETTDNTKLADVLMVFFEEDVSSFLA